MKPIVTLPEGVKAEIVGKALVVRSDVYGKSTAEIVGSQPEDDIYELGSTPEEAIANLEEQLWKRAAISE